MKDIQRTSYRLYFFFSILLLACISIEFCSAADYSILTVTGDAVFAGIFLYLGYLCKKEFEVFGPLVTILLIAFVLFYCWRSYDWISRGDIFYHDNQNVEFDFDTKEVSQIFMLCHCIKTICGLCGIMLQITVFSNPPE